jgi:hypothetical protein
MMANQCRTEVRWARPPDGLVSGTSEDMMHTVIAAARQHWQFVGRHQERPPKHELRFRKAALFAFPLMFGVCGRRMLASMSGSAAGGLE